MVFLYINMGTHKRKKKKKKKQVSGVENKVERKNRVKMKIKVAER